MASASKLAMNQLQWIGWILVLVFPLVFFILGDKRLYLIVLVPMYLVLGSLLVGGLTRNPRVFWSHFPKSWPAAIAAVALTYGTCYVIGPFGYNELLSEMGAIGGLVGSGYMFLVGSLYYTFLNFLYMKLHEDW